MKPSHLTRTLLTLIGILFFLFVPNERVNRIVEAGSRYSTLLNAPASAPSVIQTWAKTYPAAYNDSPQAIVATNDGGLVVAATSVSFGPAWIFRSDASGKIVWQRSYGETGYELPFSMAATNDGGFVVAGYTHSPGGNLWVLRLNSLGDIVWQKSYGGSEDEAAYSIAVTDDGGYIVAGTTNGHTLDNNGLWIFRLDSAGEILWQTKYISSGIDFVVDLPTVITTTSGYVIASSASFHFPDIGANELRLGAWVLSLDNSGNILWQQAYGGGDWQRRARSLVKTSDNGYLVAGDISDVSNADVSDAWLLKLDSTGAVVWQKSYGGIGTDWAGSIMVNTGGGYLVSGITKSFGAGNYDMWLLKLDASGNILWQKTYGTSDADIGRGVILTSDGGYAIAGATGPWPDSDIQVLKLDSNGNIGGTCALVGTSAATVSSPGLSLANPTITPSVTAISPVSTIATVADTNTQATTQCSSNHSISGRVTFVGGTTPVSGVTISNTITSSNTVVTTDTNIDGEYRFDDLADDIYWLTPSKSGFGFVPYETGVVGLKSDTTDLNFAASYKQDRGPWGRCVSSTDCVYLAGNQSLPFRRWGCAVTSLADVLAYRGQIGNGAPVDPIYLNDVLITTSPIALQSDGNMIWKNLGKALQDLDTGLDAEVHDPSGWSSNKDSLAQRITQIGTAVSVGDLPIISVDNGGNHYVVITGVQGTDADGNPDFVIQDPLASGWAGGGGDQSGKRLSQTVYGTIRNQWQRGKLQTIIVKPGTPAANQLSIYGQFANPAAAGTGNQDSQRADVTNGESPIQLLITDPSGNKTGYDPTTDTYLQEIPDSSYAIEGGLADPTGQSSTPLVPFFHANSPNVGEYKIEVISTRTGSYSLNVKSFVGTHSPTLQTITGTATPGAIQNYIATYTTNSTPPPIQQVIEDRERYVQYNGWRGVINAAANGGTYRISNTKNDTLTFKFTGKSVKWFSVKGPDQGKAQVRIDGVDKGTFDLYSTTPQYQFIKTFKKLTAGKHTLTLKVLGTKNTDATDTNVTFDGFIVGTATTQDDSPSVVYSKWSGKSNASASGGTYRSAKKASANAKFTFTGTSVEWITAKGPSYGIARVLIDGVDLGTRDLYDPAQQWQFAISFTGLSDAKHTIEIQPLGTKNVKSSGNSIIIDSFRGPFTAIGE